MTHGEHSRDFKLKGIYPNYLQYIVKTDETHSAVSAVTISNIDVAVNP